MWATLFLERWKRRGAELAYKWGTLDTPAESLEEPRPQFRVRETKTLTPSIFLSSSLLFQALSYFSLSLPLLAGSQALQSHNRMRGVLLSSVAEACIQVAGQPAHLYPLSLLCLPGHAHLLRAAGQSALSIRFFYVSCLYKCSSNDKNLLALHMSLFSFIKCLLWVDIMMQQACRTSKFFDGCVKKQCTVQAVGRT